MKILFLGNKNDELDAMFASYGHSILYETRPIDIYYCKTHEIDFIISFGYRHKIKKDLLEAYPSKIINCHASLLPWNRGADPNYWSWKENTPKGVTVHYVDENIDTGDIILQKEIFLTPGQTLRSSYHTLQQELVKLLKETWLEISVGFPSPPRTPQTGPGSSHKLKDIPDHVRQYLVNCNWDIFVENL